MRANTERWAISAGATGWTRVRRYRFYDRRPFRPARFLGYPPRAIALARVPADASGACEVEIRGKAYPARLVTPPFVRHGKVCEGIL